MVLNIINLNIRSLVPKITELRDFAKNAAYDVIILTESWLNANIDDAVIELENYNLIRKDRDSRGGGVIIYIKCKYEFQILNNLPVGDTEQLWVSLNIKKQTVCVGGVYKPPSYSLVDFLNNLEECLTILTPQYETIICTGDFNIDFLNIFNNGTKKLTSLIDNFGLKQIIDQPTRISATSMTLIDLVICSDNLIVSDFTVENFNLSDHCLVNCKLKFPNSTTEPLYYTYRCFKNFNYEQFYNDLSNLPFQLILHTNNIDEKISIFNRLLLSLFQIHAPIKTVRITKPRAPWLTENLKFIMNLRDKALKKYKKFKNNAFWVEYKNLKNYVNIAVKAEKRAYLQFQIENNNYNSLWRDLSDLSIYTKNTKKEVPEHLSDVNRINHYFVTSNITNNPDLHLLNYYSNNKKENVGNFEFTLTTNEEVRKILNSIKSKATGADGLNINLILYCCPFIIPFITHVVNSCILENTFPTHWKASHVIPLPKNNNPLELKDLRPISILSVLSKICEKVLHAQLCKHLELFQILPDTQSGFRKNYGCATALLEVTDDILRSTDTGNLTALVLLDYTKAFDTINYNLLLAILNYIGVGPNAINLFSNYLHGRQQIVKIGNQFSQPLTITCGVPQGSILGPLLFSVYSSSLKNSLNYCSCHHYADDTQIYYSFKLDELDRAAQILNDDIKRLVDLSQKHCLKINPSKSAILLFGSKNKRHMALERLVVKVGNTQLQIVDDVKNLGLHIDYNLRFTQHVNHMIRKSFSNLKLLYGCRHILNKKSKIILSEALILSHLNYSDVVYGPCLTLCDATRIQRIQNSCIRLIFGLTRSSHVSSKLREINWLNMRERRYLHCACLYYKIINYKSPIYLFNKIKFRSDVHVANTRGKHKLQIPQHKTSLFKRSFTYNISKILNLIPLDINKLSLRSFKLQLSKLLLSGQLII